MCRYNYGNGRCANMDVETSFCMGDSSCNISDILRTMSMRDEPVNDSWQAVPSKVWEIGTRFLD